jgi:hypothetical protein
MLAKDSQDIKDSFKNLPEKQRKELLSDLLSESKLDRDVPITNPSQMTWDRLEQLLVIISGSAVLGSAIAEQTPLGGINGAIIGVVLGTIWGWYITHKSLHE